MMTHATAAATISAGDRKHDGGTGSEVEVVALDSDGESLVKTRMSAKKGTLTSRNYFWCLVQDRVSEPVQ